MNDQPLMRIVNGCADLPKKLETRGGRESLGVAVFVDPRAGDVFHREVGNVTRRDPGAVKLRDIRVVEARQDLFFVAKTRDDFRTVHSRTNEFKRHLAPQFCQCAK